MHFGFVVVLVEKQGELKHFDVLTLEGMMSK